MRSLLKNDESLIGIIALIIILIILFVVVGAFLIQLLLIVGVLVGVIIAIITIYRYVPMPYKIYGIIASLIILVAIFLLMEVI